MRSLFLKIFLTFLITVEAISLALLVFWSVQPESAIHRWRSSTGEAVALYAQSAAEEMDRYGQVALGNYLQRLNSATRIRAGFLDENGHLLAGNIPKDAQQLIEHVRQDGEPEFDVRFASALAVQRAQGPSGRTYIFVAQMPRGPFGARRSWRGPVTYWAIAIPVAALICYWLTWYITRPVLRLRTAARQLSEGDLSARAAPRMERRRDELGELVRDFNQMAERIELLVTSQRQLISDISHELRSPLARLSVALGLARQRASEDAAGPLDRIEREAERLNELIGQLLTLARMQAAAGPPEKSRVNLRDLLADVAEDAEFEAQERGCSVRLAETQSRPANAPAPPVKACSVMGSSELLRSAFENVVRNALRYTAANSEIKIELSCHDGWASVQVCDHGPGVPDSELANLFRPFYRVANARDRQTGGVGLGLAITDRAVRLHGGTVHAENLREGGLMVEIRLPIGNAIPPAASSNSASDSTPQPAMKP